MAEKKQEVSTQSHLPFAAIEDGVVIMRDGSYRAILNVGSTNFSLKSEQEQNALIYAYQGFLNSLNYSIQIVMQSRNLDLEPYLKKLEARTLEQRNELIRQQTTDYVAYVRELITVANIMDKHFYVVVPYTPLAAAKQNLLGSLFGRHGAQTVRVGEVEFKSHCDELKQRANIVGSGLSALGLRAALLETDDIVKLLYTVYNYEIAATERLQKPGELAGTIISAKPPEAADADLENSGDFDLPAASEPPATPQPHPVSNATPKVRETNPVPAQDPEALAADQPKTLEVN